MYKNQKWPCILKKWLCPHFSAFWTDVTPEDILIWFLPSAQNQQVNFKCSFLIVCLFRFNALCMWNWFFFFIGCVRQSSRPCRSLTIWWRQFNWNRSFLRWWVYVLANFASLLSLQFLWGRWLHAAFPWASCNPAFLPAPTPISFAKFITSQALALTTIGPPLYIMEIHFSFPIDSSVKSMNRVHTRMRYTWWEKAYAIARSRLTAASSLWYILESISSIVSEPPLHSTCIHLNNYLG